jgi:hypothetical protein
MPGDDAIRVSHESFGCIRASRVSGRATLFDSAIEHQHFVMVEIGTATQEWQHGGTHHFENKNLITVAMSESQFATFITSMNTGAGAPCTLEYVMGKRMEAPPKDVNTRQTHAADLMKTMEASIESLTTAFAKAEQLAAQGKASKGELRALQEAVRMAKQHVEANMPFAMKRFAENMETLTDVARADINAYVAVMGHKALQETGLPTAERILQLGDDNQGTRTT